MTWKILFLIMSVFLLVAIAVYAQDTDTTDDDVRVEGPSLVSLDIKPSDSFKQVLDAILVETESE